MRKMISRGIGLFWKYQYCAVDGRNDKLLKYRGHRNLFQKKELEIMERVGMTKRQKRMLFMMEGGYYFVR